MEMRNVKFRYPDRIVLHGLDLILDPQETLVIMGQSASGKSTILRLLLGILRAKSGSIRFKGEEINKLGRAELNQVRSGIGMVYQYSALLSSMNVRDNIALPLRELSTKTSAEIEKIVDAKLELVGLEDVKEKVPSELSGGMRKRVSLARALALEPSLILFDEPSAGLDPINSLLIDDLIIALREKYNVTSIVVTHAMESAFRVATRMAVLHDGKIIEEGPPEVFRHPKHQVVKEFLSAYTRHFHAKERGHADSQK
jgi:phospholipid/cholesterol/gamma-HCH transport system ATP-binding protein